MKTILGSGRRNYMARIGILLVAVALIASMASCVSQTWLLTLSSGDGGKVAYPASSTTWPDGTRVPLVAIPDVGYRFVEWTGHVDTMTPSVNAATAWVTMDKNRSITANFAPYVSMIAGGGYHSVGIQSDGTVVAVGHDGYGQCSDAEEWTEIFQIAGGEYHTVGLTTEGEVVAVGSAGQPPDGRLDVGGWSNITYIAAGSWHTVAVASNGTVYATGDNVYGQCDVGDWEYITQVAAGGRHTVGLRADGTVVAVGSNASGQLPGIRWDEFQIVQIAAGRFHTVGLKADGGVVAVGPTATGDPYNFGQCNVGLWAGIKQIVAGAYHTVGLKSGPLLNLIAAGSNQDNQKNIGSWTNIRYIAAGFWHTLAIDLAGNAMSTTPSGSNNQGQWQVNTWEL